jgi:hypothetical protein
MNYILLIIAIVVFLGLMALRQNSSQSGDSDSTNQPGTKLQSRKFAATTTDPDTNIVVMTKAKGDFTNVSNTATIDAVNTVMTGNATLNGNLLRVGGKKSLESNNGRQLMMNWGKEFPDGIGLDGNVEVTPGNTLKVNGMDIFERVNYILNNAIFKDREYGIYGGNGFWNGNTPGDNKNYLGVIPDNSNPRGVWVNNRKTARENMYRWYIGDILGGPGMS